MTAVLIFVATLVAAFLLLLTALLSAEIVLGFLFRQSRRVFSLRNNATPRVAILMPAHNEALIIASTVRSIRSEMREGDRLVVVADNCDDETSAIAASEGAETIERVDPTRRGKGYALQFGICHLRTHPPDAVIIIDADCRIARHSLDRLTNTCLALNRPSQALYTMIPPPNAGERIRVASFAWVVKNRARPLGLKSIGMPCALMGTGMAFPWELLKEVNLGTSHIVEDLKLGIEFVRKQLPPYFCPEAEVTSQFPTSEVGLTAQRTRWEHGHLSTILSDALPLIGEGLRSRSIRVLAAGLDLAIPPLAILALLIAINTIGDAIIYVVAGTTLPIGLSAASIGLLTLAVLVGWYGFARHILSFRNLVFIPFYVLSKIPLYLRFAVARQVAWVRSKRD